MLLAVYLSIIFLSFIPGYLFYLNFLKESTDKPEEISAWSFGISLPMIASMHMLSFVSGRDLLSTNIILYVLINVVLFAILKLRRSTWIWPNSDVVTLFCIFSIYCFLLLTTIQNYFIGFSFDWSLYFPNVLFFCKQMDISHFMQGLSMEYLVKRTPFFSLINAFFLTITSPQYFYLQTVSTFINSLIFLNFTLIAAKYFKKTTYKLLLLLLPFIPIITCRINFPTPKPFVVFYILLAMTTYVDIRNNPQTKHFKRNSFLTAFFIICGIMSHPMAIFYCFAIALDQLYLKFYKKLPFNWRLSGFTILMAGIFILPWIAWLLNTFGYEKLCMLPATMTERKIIFTEYIFRRAEVILTTLFLPTFELITILKNAQIPAEIGSQKLFVWGNYAVRMYLETFIGGFTFSAIFFFIITSIRTRLKIPQEFKSLLTLTTIGALTIIFVNLPIENSGQAFNMMGPLVVIVFIYLAYQCQQLSSRMQVFMLCVVIFEYISVRIIIFELTSIYHKVTLILNKKGHDHFYTIFSERLQHPAVIISIMIFMILMVYLTCLSKICSPTSKER